MDRESGTPGIQDGYFGRARRERAWLTVYLNSGKKLTGRIRSFDRYTLILEDRGIEQMIFKHAIATITAARAFSNPIGLAETDRSPRPGRTDRKAGGPSPPEAAGDDAPDSPQPGEETAPPDSGR